MDKAAIKSELKQRYMEGNESVATIAEESGVALRTLQRWASEGGWVAAREAYRAATEEAAIAAAIEKGIGTAKDRNERLNKLADELVARLSVCIENMDVDDYKMSKPLAETIRICKEVLCSGDEDAVNEMVIRVEGMEAEWQN